MGRRKSIFSKLAKIAITSAGAPAITLNNNKNTLHYDLQ